tara:strand:- start:944 stop:1114 length:171 start_codon:yes stop_codon:yes gene_type:complete
MFTQAFAGNVPVGSYGAPKVTSASGSVTVLFDEVVGAVSVMLPPPDELLWILIDAI